MYVYYGGGGIFIKFPDGSTIRKSEATGSLFTNYRAEASALLTAAETLIQCDNLLDHVVFLTDCRSVLQSLQTRERDQILQDIKKAHQTLSKKTTLVLQWIPSHCGVFGNEEADKLSKAGSKQEQTDHPVSLGEVKSIFRSHFRTKWKERLHVQTQRIAYTAWREPKELPSSD